MQKKSVVSACIGGFDGMHLGHMRLFSELDQDGAVIVISKRAKSSLTPGKSRQKQTKIPCFFYDLDDICHLHGSEFIRLLKKDFINLKKIIVGYDFKFGKNRSCNAENLKEFFDGDVVIVDEVCLNGIGIHSSIIKGFIHNGDMESTTKFLGRRYCVVGEVMPGQGIGAKELVATINFDAKNYILPKDGIYATIAKIKDKTYKSVTFIGKRISTDMQFSAETHIIEEFDQNYFSKMEVCFVKFIRENLKFNTLPELKKQILLDIKNTNQILDEEL